MSQALQALLLATSACGGQQQVWCCTPCKHWQQSIGNAGKTDASTIVAQPPGCNALNGRTAQKPGRKWLKCGEKGCMSVLAALWLV
jgi:hypothetical protein